MVKGDRGYLVFQGAITYIEYDDYLYDDGGCKVYQYTEVLGGYACCSYDKLYSKYSACFKAAIKLLTSNKVLA